MEITGKVRVTAGEFKASTASCPWYRAWGVWVSAAAGIRPLPKCVSRQCHIGFRGIIVRASDAQSVRRSMRSLDGQSVRGSWSTHLQWMVKVSGPGAGVIAVVTDCLVNSDS